MTESEPAQGSGTVFEGGNLIRYHGCVQPMRTEHCPPELSISRSPVVMMRRVSGSWEGTQAETHEPMSKNG